jgi:hypothetical protein
MTPEQAIKREMLLEAIKCNDDLNWDCPITADNVDEAWQSVLVDNDAHWDCKSEFRSSGEDTDIPCDWSRHYESKSVARKLSDGSWVGWTYWYGGGKHGEPEAVEWMEDAYFLNVTEEEKVVTVRTFTKLEPANETA